MSKSAAWDPSSIHFRARRLAEEAADRAGVSLQDWLDEAILRCAARGEAPSASSANEVSAKRLDRSLIEETEDLIDQAMERIDWRVRRGEERMARALESLSSGLDATHGAAGREPPVTGAPESVEARAGRRDPTREGLTMNRRLDDQLEEITRRMNAARQAAGSQSAPRRPAQPIVEVDAARAQAPYAEAKASGPGPLQEPGENAVDSLRSCEPACAASLVALRQDIAAIAHSLADLAPRNAVIAIEGAVRDLTERIALLRRDSESESLLAPLDAMAAKFRATLRSWNPQAAVAPLEREIAALAGRVEALAESAIDPERFDRIQQQTEEIRNLLAAAATGSAPLERLERQVGELADRIEGLGASPAPQVESARMAAALAELRGEIERTAPLPALTLVQRQLEHIATRLDEEARTPANQATGLYTFEDLARKIEDIHQSVNAGLETKTDMGALESSLLQLSAKIENPSAEPLAALVRDISDKLDSVARRDAEAAPVEIEPRLTEISGKLDRLHELDLFARLRSVERVLLDLDAKVESGAARGLDRAFLSQIAEAVAQRLEKDSPFRMDAQGLAEQIAYVHTRLEELPQLDEMQGFMRSVSVRLNDLASAQANHDKGETPTRAERMPPAPSSAFVVRAIEAMEAVETTSATQRPIKSTASAGAESAPALDLADEDVLLEPGAGAPRRAHESTREIGSKTSPSISVHIAAARRAAHSALSEASGSNAPAAAPNGGRGVERAKSLYTSHKRPVLFAVAFAVIAIAATRLVGVYAPAMLRSDVVGRPAKVARVETSSGDLSRGAAPKAPRIDVTPTASIPPDSGSVKVSGSSKTVVSGLSVSLSTELPTPLRDAVVAGSPAAEYELAQRLLEGRGLPQDQEAAAFWFERAASSGLAPAQFRLATLYSKGVGLARDGEAARRWYEKAAAAGNARAAHNLAVMYAEPTGGKPDYVTAAKWFLKAAELGVRDSQFDLAVLYARGLGVDQDLKLSWMWFSLATAQGDTDAAKKRDEVAAKMTPAALAAAADALAKFRPVKPDPAVNDVAAPAGGWDGKSVVSPPVGAGPAPASIAGPSASP